MFRTFVTEKGGEVKNDVSSHELITTQEHKFYS